MTLILTTLITAAVLIQVAVFATTIYLHRTATHKALTMHPALAWAFKSVLWLTTGLCTKEWVAVHRKHHAFTDVVGDPHSPELEGFWHIQLGNVFYYLRELRGDREELFRSYAVGIEEGWWDKHLFNHGLAGLGLGTASLCGLGWWIFGPIGIPAALVAAALHAVLYVFVLSSSINGLCHSRGYRTFKNTATNVRWLAWLTGGEGLHNNHHGYPRSPKFSYRVTEFDPAWPLIRLLVFLRLAKPYKTIEESVA